MSSIFPETLHPLPDRLELWLGLAPEMRIEQRRVTILGVARHDRRRRNSLRPVHPALKIIVPQPLAGELEVGPLPFENLQRFLRAGVVTSDARVTFHAGDFR